MNNSSIKQLLEDLKNPDDTVRQEASSELWRLWFRQKGVLGLELLQQSQAFLEVGELNKAETVLNQLIADMPDFAEAWNRRAILYYILSQYRKAIADCQRTIQIVPYHFGALHGMGLCHVALGEYRQAIQAFHKALQVQPYAIENQRWILECTAKLS
ncbi:tetratricopeptide repeat protein [Microseira wollei]|uniref:TPR repeat-containing protein n=1 Tax=Microseira wollei NIES-4236 TaxID=2530354 RepID=A0AAV3XJT7_9CYAN|nr:tetratricopeptide repeat protein [Microseira wollei]GET40435.1 TPR repeat-containing protein [Microseira wollei NIES-4236]